MTPLAAAFLGAAAALAAEWVARAAWSVRTTRRTCGQRRRERALVTAQDQAMRLTGPPPGCALCGYNPRHVQGYTGWVRILETCPAHQQEMQP